jgi:very-short-patch-repair endonuclease
MPIPRIVLRRRVDPAKLRLAKALRRQMTPEERLLWAALRGNRLGGFHFRRQQVIEGFIVDFYCHAAALVVEVDGGVHESQHDADQCRDEKLTGLGLLVVRCSNEEVVGKLEEVLAGILSVCRGRAGSEDADQASPLPNREGGQGVRSGQGR